MKINVNSPIEEIMKNALDKNGFRYEQEYQILQRKSSFPKYILDFLVYGEKCKIVVECDGYNYHKKNIQQKAHDAKKDLWLITHGFDDVLRFSYKDINSNIDVCIEEIKKVIKANDNKYLNKGEVKKSKKQMDYKNSKRKRVEDKQKIEFDSNLKHVDIFAFGFSNSRYKGKGGIGVILKHGEYIKKIQLGYNNTNTSRMRLIAIIKGLKALKYKCHVRIYTNDGFIARAYNNSLIDQWKEKGWKTTKGKNILNQNLWMELQKITEKHIVEFQYIDKFYNIYFNEARSLSKQATFRFEDERRINDIL